MSELREAARRYAEIGFPVFPLLPIVENHCACGALECAGKHPATKGWQRSISSVLAVDSLWADHLGPRGIGLACGERARVWGLDVDPRHDGAETIRELQTRHGAPPSTVVSKTGSGGWHLLFAWPEDGTIPTRASIAPGLDVRGEGGYLVLPPSPHISGRRYEWIVSPHELDPAPAPDWLLKLVRQNERRSTCATGGGEHPLIPLGRRHEALVSFCGLLRASGLREDTIVECGHAFLRHQVATDPAKPLDLEHAEKTMRSIARRYPPRYNRAA